MFWEAEFIKNVLVAMFHNNVQITVILRELVMVLMEHVNAIQGLLELIAAKLFCLVQTIAQDMEVVTAQQENALVIQIGKLKIVQRFSFVSLVKLQNLNVKEL